VKATGGLSYDAFCVATAQHLKAPLWTGDPEIALPLNGRGGLTVAEVNPSSKAKVRSRPEGWNLTAIRPSLPNFARTTSPVTRPGTS